MSKTKITKAEEREPNSRRDLRPDATREWDSPAPYATPLIKCGVL